MGNFAGKKYLRLVSEVLARFLEVEIFFVLPATHITIFVMAMDEAGRVCLHGHIAKVDDLRGTS